MIGGTQAAFDAARPLLAYMGTSLTLVGEGGAGCVTKLANQIIVACNIQALSEALTLAKMAGVDPELVFQAIRGGLAGSTVMNAKAPMMIEGNDKPGFKIDLHIKDLNNALDCAHTVGSPPAHDRRGAGDLPVAAQQRLRPGRSQLHYQVLQEAHRHRVPVRPPDTSAR